MEREQFSFWQLANYFIMKLDYRLIHMNQEANEIWFETVRTKNVHVIRLVAIELDWSNWLKRDIVHAGMQAEKLRRQLFKRDFHVLNIYVSEYPPVDNYEHILEQPYVDPKEKTEVHTLLFVKEKMEGSLTKLNHILNSNIQLQDWSPFLENDMVKLREETLRQVKERAKEEKALFEYGKPFFTFLFIAIQLVMFILLETRGGSTDVETLIKFGAKYNPLILTGEWWRFFTPIFLHIGLLHLVMNTLALFYLGTAVEKVFGRFRFLLIYLFSGFAGTAASFVFTSNLSAGASGAIFGCFGALLYIGVTNSKLFFRTIGANVLILIGINLVFGFTVPGIDNAGHIGGLVGGFLATGIVHFPQKRRWGSQLLFLLISAAAVYMMLNNGYHGDRADVVNTLAQQEIENGNVEKAYEILSTYVSDGKGDAVSYFQLAYTEIQLQKLDEAKQHLQTAIDLQPALYEAHFNLAVIYMEEGNNKKAAEHAEKAKNMSDQEKYQKLLKKIE